MKRLLILSSILCFCFSCSSTKQLPKNTTQTLKDDDRFLITELSNDSSYGLSPKNPVEVGGANNGVGPKNERRFLNALAGPNGEQISYYRAGSCCAIKSKNDPFGFGKVMLDNYRVTWENSKDTVSIYINMYDSGKLKAPVGFTIRK